MCKYMKPRVLDAILKKISLVDFGPKKYLPKVGGTSKYLSENVGLENYLPQPRWPKR